MNKCTIDWIRDENQSLTTQAKNNKKKKEEHSHQEWKDNSQPISLVLMRKDTLQKHCPKKEEWKDDMI